jgi:hypothetical protein
MYIFPVILAFIPLIILFNPAVLDGIPRVAMPAVSAAWMIIEPFGACIGTPSISMFTTSVAGAVGVAALMRPSP